MDRTEEKLIKAAREVRKRLGYDKATTIEIAKEAGVSEMTLFRKFKSKEDLFAAAANESPSSYDYFYYDFEILQKALSLRKEILKGEKAELISGYIYFIEFCIAKLIQNVEEAPYNEYIFEIVNWGRFDISDKEIQYLKETSHSFKIVYDLNDYRSLLSGSRRTLPKIPKDTEKKSLEEILGKLEKLSREIGSEMEKLYNAKKKQEISENSEKLMIFHWFMVTYVYEPPRLFFSTISNPTARSFIPDSQCLMGFKFSVEKIMNWLTDDKYIKEIKDGLLQLDMLEHVHGFYSMMHGTVFKGANFTRMFDIVEPKWDGETIFKGKTVDEFYQLNLIFRGREIKVINVEEIGGLRGNREAVKWLLIDAVFGAITLGVPKVEIIQFEEHVKDGKDWDNFYTYALYLPMHGMIGDASTWSIFPRLDGTSNWEPYDDVNTYLENAKKEWGKRFNIRRYKIEDGLLQKYIDKKDLATVWKKDTQTRLDTSRGLLAEFLAYFYIWYTCKATLVEFHREENNTDVDVVAEDPISRYIIQAKNSLTANRKRLPKELDNIAKQLEKVEKKYSVSTKATKKMLFVIDWDWDDDKFSHIEDQDRYLLNTYYMAKQILKKQGIDLVIYSGMKNLLKVRYGDFEKKMRDALGLFDPNDV